MQNTGAFVQDNIGIPGQSTLVPLPVCVICDIPVVGFGIGKAQTAEIQSLHINAPKNNIAHFITGSEASQLRIEDKYCGCFLYIFCNIAKIKLQLNPVYWI